jgi:hypothetical protein
MYWGCISDTTPFHCVVVQGRGKLDDDVKIQWLRERVVKVPASEDQKKGGRRALMVQ